MYINADKPNSFDNIEGIKSHDFGKFMKLALDSEFGKPTYWLNPRKHKNLSNTPDTNKNQKIPEKSETDEINRNENEYKLYFHPPVTISDLSIQFKNYHEQFFDFHGLEHSLFFRFEMFNFHYDNIVMDYNFPDLNPDEDLIDKVEEEIEDMDRSIILRKAEPDQDNLV